MPTQEMYKESVKITHLHSHTLRNFLRFATDHGIQLIFVASSVLKWLVVVSHLKFLLQPLQVLVHRLFISLRTPRRLIFLFYATWSHKILNSSRETNYKSPKNCLSQSISWGEMTAMVSKNLEWNRVKNLETLKQSLSSKDSGIELFWRIPAVSSSNNDFAWHAGVTQCDNNAVDCAMM